MKDLTIVKSYKGDQEFFCVINETGTLNKVVLFDTLEEAEKFVEYKKGRIDFINKTENKK